MIFTSKPCEFTSTKSLSFALLGVGKQEISNARIFSKLEVGETFLDLHLLVMAVHCEVPPGLGGDTELAGDGVPHQEARHSHRHQVHRHPLNRPHLPSLTWQFPLFLSVSPGSLRSTFTGDHLHEYGLYYHQRIHHNCSEDMGDYGKIWCDME